MIWKHPKSPSRKKIQNCSECRKSHGDSLLDLDGILLLEILQHGSVFTAERYRTTMEKLKAVIRCKRPGLLTSWGVICCAVMPHRTLLGANASGCAIIAGNIRATHSKDTI